MEVQYCQPAIKVVHKKEVVLLEAKFFLKVNRTGRHLDSPGFMVDIGEGQALGTAEYRTPVIDTAVAVFEQKYTVIFLHYCRPFYVEQGIL